MPDPGLTQPVKLTLHLAAQGHYKMTASDHMKHKGFRHPLAYAHLLFENFGLNRHIAPFQTVKPRLADRHHFRERRKALKQRQLVGNFAESDVACGPRMYTHRKGARPTGRQT